MMTAEKIAALTAAGFNRWTKGAMDRLYVNASVLGLTCTYYKTGNISSATFAGRKISNSRAYKMKAAKTFVDLVRNQIVSDDPDLAAAVAEMLGVDYSAGETIIAIA